MDTEAAIACRRRKSSCLSFEKHTQRKMLHCQNASEVLSILLEASMLARHSSSSGAIYGGKQDTLLHPLQPRFWKRLGSRQSVPEVRLEVGCGAAGRLVWHASGAVLWQEGRHGAQHLPLRRRQLNLLEVLAIIVVPADKEMCSGSS